MTTYYDLYGFTKDDIDAIARTLEQCLGMRLMPRDSSFIGEYYSGPATAADLAFLEGDDEGDDDNTATNEESAENGEVEESLEDAEEFTLQENYNSIERGWAEKQFQQYPVILYARITKDPHAIEIQIKQAFGDKAMLLSRKDDTELDRHIQQTLANWNPFLSLYGFLNNDLDAIAEALNRSLEIQLIPQDSPYTDKFYDGSGQNDETLTLQKNFDTVENNWTEPDFQQYPVLLEILTQTHPGEIDARIKQAMGNIAVLLRRKNIERLKKQANQPVEN